ncbi:unnamed protein product [Angiostrongylus costaricensis]|uniref:Uncharacterized protein n=1 Tax=Angiostrongylus costaricensis TaxID=334426 RepID=A0A0R3PJG7_ANGCS|nr:unnamed protein product [Angiostrongylus costaricensis]
MMNRGGEYGIDAQGSLNIFWRRRCFGTGPEPLPKTPISLRLQLACDQMTEDGLPDSFKPLCVTVPVMVWNRCGTQKVPIV